MPMVNMMEIKLVITIFSGSLGFVGALSACPFCGFSVIWDPNGKTM